MYNCIYYSFKTTQGFGDNFWDWQEPFDEVTKEMLLAIKSIIAHETKTPVSQIAITFLIPLKNNYEN